jgi:Fur family transcriptional regulator, ferric uptake regulator
MAMRKLREETELFHAFLRQNGLKKTYQKDLILEVFLNAEGHLSVDDVYALVKKKDRRVGIVTVFRTMKSLKACGIAKEIVLGDGLTRFEHSYHHPAHHHIVCVGCQKAIEYVCPALDRIQDEIVQKYHFQPLHNRFQTFGICENCREHRPASDSAEQDTERIFARDALKMILCMTGRALEFYRTAAKRNQDPGGKNMFERMVSEEEKHIAELSQKMAELLGPERRLDLLPVFLHFDENALDALIPSVSSHEASGELKLDAKAAAALILELNRKTTEFFEAYAGKFSETQGKQILLSFAEQEGAHGNHLRQLLQEPQNQSGGVSS